MTGDESDVIEAAMGAGVRRAVARFLDSWSGVACGHGDRPQVAQVGHARSTCFGCAWSTAAVEGWAVGPCDVCGAAQDGRAERVWLVQAVPGLVAAVRVCARCSVDELQEIEEDDMVCGHCEQLAVEAATGRRSREAMTGLHAECRAALSKAYKGVKPESRRMRIALLRARFALGGGDR